MDIEIERADQAWNWSTGWDNKTKRYRNSKSKENERQFISYIGNLKLKENDYKTSRRAWRLIIQNKKSNWRKFISKEWNLKI